MSSEPKIPKKNRAKCSRVSKMLQFRKFLGRNSGQTVTFRTSAPASPIKEMFVGALASNTPAINLYKMTGGKGEEVIGLNTNSINFAKSAFSL